MLRAYLSKLETCDKQNFSARGHNLERRLTVPSKLRIHKNHQIENRWSIKRNADSRSDGLVAWQVIEARRVLRARLAATAR
jgi:hypothetical protein